MVLEAQHGLQHLELLLEVQAAVQHVALEAINPLEDLLLEVVADLLAEVLHQEVAVTVLQEEVLAQEVVEVLEVHHDLLADLLAAGLQEEVDHLAEEDNRREPNIQRI